MAIELRNFGFVFYNKLKSLIVNPLGVFRIDSLPNVWASIGVGVIDGLMRDATRTSAKEIYTKIISTMGLTTFIRPL